MQSAGLELRKVTPVDVKPLAAFFRTLRESGSESFFHPHPLTDDEAALIAAYGGQDLYYVLSQGTEIIGYGMLRGWDEGFNIPSLGIAISPSLQGMGLGRVFILFLHAVAFLRGATRVRLTVSKRNPHARQLYTSLGYVFDESDADSLIGFRQLDSPSVQTHFA